MVILRIIAVLLLGPVAAQAADPVKQIGLYVEPFYNSGSTDEARRVAVGKRFDALLASSKRDDILAVAQMIKANPQTVTPMTMMVLAVRLYDVGERDEAVFWFYAAKDRTIILMEVAVPKAPQLAQALDAVASFATLAGPTINGYAFCDLQNQQALRKRAIDWVAANPYEVMFMSQLPARGEDRGGLAAAALKLVRDNAEKERTHFADTKVREDFYVTRRKNEADVKFC